MLIEIKNLSFAYGHRTVINGLSHTINSGDYLVIQGKNGTGKTTLIKCLLGINSVKNGMIFFDGQDINVFGGWTRFGYVSQNLDDFNYEFPLTVEELLKFSSITKMQQSNYLKHLDQMGILDIVNQNINSLSGGQLQRVFIVRAMLNNPQVLILDEPTASIDKQNTAFFYKTVEELNKLGITIILITHTESLEHINYSHRLTMSLDLTTEVERKIPIEVVNKL
ncbi:MAG: ATP-binding cassette domain-containing protein [Bacilli bacterium]|nr:ATP-binding cassette domain-containing protein [Bacilli bacterium]MBN2876985.1 ATP-binding cassette domain-containing protein [Bacilli bacterium]